MNIIFDWINSLTSFQQSLLGSLIFAITSWVAQKAFQKAKSTGSKFWSDYSRLDVIRHFLHKEYVNSNNIMLSNFGTTFVLLQAFRWIIRGALVLIFFLGIRAIINRDWLLIAAAWFTFNCMLEAWNWIKDSSNPNQISHVPEEFAAEVIESLKPKQNKGIESDS